MPTKRKRVPHRQLTLGPLEEEHLLLGNDHLLAGDCHVCGDPAAARPLWEANRDRITAEWKHKFPTYGACLFDRALLGPEPRGNHERDLWSMIAWALERMDSGKQGRPKKEMVRTTNPYTRAAARPLSDALQEGAQDGRNRATANAAPDKDV